MRRLFHSNTPAEHASAGIFAIVIITIIQWLLCYLITYLLNMKNWSELTNAEASGSVWQIASLTWIGGEVIQMTLSWLIGPMCDKGDKYSIGGLIGYTIIAFIILYASAMGLFYFFHDVLYDQIVCRVLGHMKDVNMCQAVNYRGRPAFFLGFGSGAVYNAFLSVLPQSKNGKKSEPVNDPEQPAQLADDLPSAQETDLDDVESDTGKVVFLKTADEK